MNVCCACGHKGSWPEVIAQSEQRSANGRGWDALFACADYRACERRILVLMHEETPQTAQLGGTAVRGV